ncbi:TLC domain-containing protein [Aspergillus oleicola]
MSKVNNCRDRAPHTAPGVAPIMPVAHVTSAEREPLEMKARRAKQEQGQEQEQGLTGLLSEFACWLRDNQISLSFNIIALLFFTHVCVPNARSYTTRLFWVSHYNPQTGEYAIGNHDFYFLAFCIVLFTGLRASVMEYVLAPMAKRWGVRKRKDVTRFSEQAWLLCYYSVFWTLGMYLYCTSKYFLNLREMFTDWPSRELPEITKTYILAQWAFWLQQLIVINIEERRKDHWQMLSHHIVTIILLWTSYALHLTRVANLILVLMDVVDIFFPLAKCLKYLGFSTVRDIMFGFFMTSWFVTRHVFYLRTMWSIYTDMYEEISVGCYHGPQDKLAGPTPFPTDSWSHILEPFRRPSGTICYSDNIRLWFLGALGFLQLITMYWFVLIVRVAIRVIKGQGADDIRSDDEDESGEEGETEIERNGREKTLAEARAFEVKSAIPTEKGIHNAAASSSSGSISAGRNLSGHINRNRKELLGRIGCEKHVD